MWLSPATFRCSARLSSGDLILVRETAEDLLSADPVLGEVDLRWPGVSLSRFGKQVRPIEGKRCPERH
jgi:hypothetical protein